VRPNAAPLSVVQDGRLPLRSVCANRISMEFTSALENFKAAFNLFEASGDTLHAALLLSNIGSVHRDMGEYYQALGMYQKALPLFERLENKEGIADQYTNIAYIHVMEGDLIRALSCYRKALPLYDTPYSRRKYENTKNNIENLAP